MRPQDVIRRKRDGLELSRQEIEFFVEGVSTGAWADYQAAAFLMAVYLKGMTELETEVLTTEMLGSGEILSFSDLGQPVADKHSTGGVGDKTSLILAPLAAASGVAVPMISVRGLGYTGGTLDKLEAIPGYRVRLSAEEFRSILKRVGFAMMGQTEEIAPADRKLYALRDATETVEALPLIVASIMSKKLAAGLHALVLDVKTGTGAFMRDEEQARALAKALVRTGRSCGVSTEALLTDMNQPLGRAVGHANEVRECIEILRGEWDERTRPVVELSVELAAHMVALSSRSTPIREARGRVQRALESGEGLERFRLSVEAQGGDPRVCDRPASLADLTLLEMRLKSPRDGYVTEILAAEIGRAVASIGGGRLRVEDEIDAGVGYLAEAQLGDEVREGDTLGVLLCRTRSQGEEALRGLGNAYRIESRRVEPPTLIKEIITE